MNATSLSMYSVRCQDCSSNRIVFTVLGHLNNGILSHHSHNNFNRPYDQSGCLGSTFPPWQTCEVAQPPGYLIMEHKVFSRLTVGHLRSWFAITEVSIIIITIELPILVLITYSTYYSIMIPTREVGFHRASDLIAPYHRRACQDFIPVGPWRVFSHVVCQVSCLFI